MVEFLLVNRGKGDMEDLATNTAVRISADDRVRSVTVEERQDLARLPLMADLEPEQRDDLLSAAHVRSLSRHTELFRQGDVPTHLNILLAGQGVLSSTGGSAETVVHFLSAGDVFMVPAVLTGCRYLVGARALTAGAVLEIPADKVKDAVATMSPLAVSLLRSLSHEYRTILREVRSLKTDTAAQRLAGYLIETVPPEKGSRWFTLPHSKILIAARLGIRPETLSRTFAALKPLGVTVRGDLVAIEDRVGLAAFTEMRS